MAGTTTIATLRNVVAMVQLVERVMTRAPTLPGMACFYGPSGYGKSHAATYAANTFDAYYVEAESTWTRGAFCEAICLELGLEPRGRIDQMVRDIYRELAATGRPLFIDEADHVIACGLIEIARDIHQKSDAPVILIGEENLPRKLMKWERVHGRMMPPVAAEPGTLSDLNLLAEIYCPDVSISEDLKARLLSDSHNSIRRICMNLHDLRLFAQRQGLRHVDGDDWGNASFFGGQAPQPRGLK